MNLVETLPFEPIGDHRRTVPRQANYNQRFVGILWFEWFRVKQQFGVILGAVYMEKLILRRCPYIYKSIVFYLQPPWEQGLGDLVDVQNSYPVC